MTKKKLNNLLNFLIFVLPIISLLIFSSVKFLRASGTETTGLIDFLETFIGSFDNIPLFGQLVRVIELCFNVELVPNNVIIYYLIAFICYLIISTICIIIKDLLLLIVNICNKYLFLED